jgi:hypothetical protein
MTQEEVLKLVESEVTRVTRDLELRLQRAEAKIAELEHEQRTRSIARYQ